VSQTTTRQTAEVRREAVLEAARSEFAQHGLHGASTDAIARRAGISQPYLFRLFGSKKALFIAVNDQCFQPTLNLFRESASATSGRDALHAIGAAYGRLIESDRTMLQGQLQAYAASVVDKDVRAAFERRLRRFRQPVASLSTNASRRSDFFAKACS
jgi:AcrR family transcriptional regulator